MTDAQAVEESLMRRALELARRGIGFVEPNPPVGAVVADEQGRVLGEGWHQQFGGAHAEIHALTAAGEKAQGATLYVTLEPCSHFGKTPPCTRSVIAAGIRRVVVATVDPATHSDVRGIDELRSSGIDVVLGTLGEEARRLIAPFTRLMTAGLPWVHAKWAMTLDGKIATSSGSSRWITNAASRSVVHQLRGRMDAILTGVGTVLADDPLLTAHPSGPRTATRIVLDSTCRIPLDSQLVRTAHEVPVMIATTQHASVDRIEALRRAGVEVVLFSATAYHRPDLHELLHELGNRRMTNLFVEGGGRILGSFFDQRLIQEVHAFVAPTLAGGQDSPTPIAGLGVDVMENALRLDQTEIQVFDGDIYIRGLLPTWQLTESTSQTHG